MENESDVAIVGMAGRFPGAPDLDGFWRNLVGGVESIARLTDDEILQAGVPPEILAREDYVRASPILDDPALFDAAFFGFAPAEAATLDPQQRILLEVAHAALEDAGCDPGRWSGRIGVFAGSAMNTYFLDRGLEAAFAENYLPTLIANDKDFLATRISYKLGLRGPSLTVQSACSTSLVAVHLARQSLLNGESDAALAGAVSVRVPHRAGYLCEGGGVMSPDGHVRAFDASANGTVFGSGAGIVVLKLLSRAREDGDRIHAVIKGSAVNNDGAEKAGYAAPSVQGQCEALVEALANSGLSAERISYLEAHGSGTPVGDRIELLALTKGFRQFTARRGYCALGSVKTNIGHLDAAAGMAGLIKTVLSLRHGRIPGTLHYSRSSPESELAATPFFVSRETIDWPASEGSRCAAVMATGMGGTNASLILEAAPEAAPASEGRAPHLLLLSARSAPALTAMAGRLADFLAEGASRPGAAPLADVARTLQAGRKFLPHRRFVVCSHPAQAVEALRDPKAAAQSGRTRADGAPQVAFLLPGVGDHYVGMGRELHERFDVFRAEVGRCAEILHPLLGLDIRDLLYPCDRSGKASPSPRGIDLKRMLGRVGEAAEDPIARKLDQTQYAQPALFTVEYALACLWMHWGVRPARLVGHSMGEYVAACLAGVFSLPDALRLIATRARLVEGLAPGSMLAVMLSEKELLPLLGPELSVALINGRRLCVVAGPQAAMGDFRKRMEARGVGVRPVRNAHAFHSRLLDPIVEELEGVVRQVPLSAPRIPFISNATGTWITAEQAANPRYWAEHARRTARFADALDEVMGLEDACLLEVGPGRTLGMLAQQHAAPGESAKRAIVPSLRHDYDNQPDADVLFAAVGRLWCEGVGIDWRTFGSEPGRRVVSLPGYPFQRVRHWLEPRAARARTAGGKEGMGSRPDLGDWFHVPSWERVDFPGQPRAGKDEGRPSWLVVGAPSEFADRLMDLLDRRGCTAGRVCFGRGYTHHEENRWEIRAAAMADWLALLGAIGGRLAEGLNIVHLGALGGTLGPPGPLEPTAAAQETGFHSLVALVQALGERMRAGRVRVAAVTRQVHDVSGEETLDPSAATVTGLCGVMGWEHPRLAGFSVDLPAEDAHSDAWASSLLDEFADPAPGAVLAYRGRHRWERHFRPLRLPRIEADGPSAGQRAPGRGDSDATLRRLGLKRRGVYLITGGLGGIGLAVARYLAEICQARVILTRRTPFPSREEWPARLTGQEAPESERKILAELLEIEGMGGRVEVHACDVADRVAMRRVLTESISRHGSIDGVIHAAGILRDGVIQLQTRVVADSIFRAKVEGTWVLYELLREIKPDLLVLFSSLSSVVPVHGQGAYCAANAFLDAFAPFAQGRAAERVLAINWPAWREAGILVGLKARAGLENINRVLLERSISTAEGLEIFRRALAARIPQVAASQQDLGALRLESEALAVQAAGMDIPVSPVPAPEEPDAVEETLVPLWREVLGVESIGRDDSFLDLGGHSLLAMRLLAQIRSAYDIEFSLRKFFEAPTIAGTAAAIRAQLTAEIDALSEEEVGRSIR